MSSAVKLLDRRPHAILDTGEKILVRDLRSLDDYTLASVYKRGSYVGEDCPPSVFGSIWFQDICDYCMSPVGQSHGVSRIIPPSWGGARGGWNSTLTCEECIRKKSTKAGYSTFDGREGVYWDGSLWCGEKVPRPKFARDKAPPTVVYYGQHDVQQILPHRLTLPPIFRSGNFLQRFQVVFLQT